MATKTKDNAAAGHQPVGKNISETRRVSRLRRHARLRKKIAGFIRSASDSKEDEREADGERTKRAIVVMAMFAGAGYALYTYGLPLLPKSVLVNLRPFVGKSPYSLLYSIVSLCAAVAACFFR